MAIFNYIVSLSIRACVLVPIVVAVRFLIDKYPKKYSYALWLMVFLSLVVKISVPGNVDTPISQMQHTIQQQYDNVLNSYTEDIVIHRDNTVEYAQAVQQGIQPVISEEAKYVITSADNITPPKTVEKAVMPTVHILWFVGVLVFAVIYAKNIVGILSATKFAVHYKYDIYYSEYVNSPFVFGIIKPKIYLPYAITKEQAEAVIQHERVHIKRLDYIIKPLCFFIAALHWFNPFVWVAFYLMTKDMELSCDEAVIKYADEQDKKDYCNALLQFALKDKSYKMGTVMFGESDCSSRIKNVLSFKNPKKLISILLAAVVAAVAIVAITAEKQTEPQNNPFAEMTFAQLEEYDFQQKSYLKQKKELNNLLQTMDNFDDKEIEKYIETQYNAYLSKDNVAVLKDISVHQDKLAMVYSQNKKSLCNGVVEICIQLLPNTNESASSDTSYSNLYMGNMLESIKSNSNFLNLKTKQLDITVIDADGIVVDTYNYTSPNSFEDEESVHAVNKAAWKSAEYLFKQQPKEELAAQKQAFDYGKSHNNFILKKFGIDNDNQLYIEYTFEDDWLLKGDGTAKEKIAARTAELNDIYADISQNVVQSDAMQQYIAQKGAGTAVIAFNHRFLDNGCLQFKIILDKTAPQFTHDINTEDGLPAEIKENSFIWPVVLEDTRVSRGFAGQYPAHDGIDIAGRKGTPIYAAASGTVDVSKEDTTFNGNHIIINHGNGYRTLYAHCDTLIAKEGDSVQQGQLIATIGSTGNSTGNHLHFGLSKNYEYINPNEFLEELPIVYGEEESCKACGGPMSVVYNSFGNWYNTEQTDCQHGFPWGVDITQKRGFIKTSICQDCGLGENELMEETRLDCHGFVDN